MDEADPPASPRYDRALLLLGAKRNEVLTLAEVHRYGSDSFGDPDYLRLYGMAPDEWYARGIRLLGRTAVECTRDDLARAIAHDIAALVATLTTTPPAAPVTVIDPFAGSGNTLYWILRAIPGSAGLGFELDPRVCVLSRANLASLDRPVNLVAGDYDARLDEFRVPPGHVVIAFVAPPWGTALDGTLGLDLRRTTPPVAEVVAALDRRYGHHRTIYAIQVYEALEPESLAEVRALFDWSDLRVYDLNATGGNHGILLATRGFRP